MNIINKITSYRVNFSYKIPILFITDIPNSIYETIKKPYNPQIVYSKNVSQNVKQQIMLTYNVREIIANNLAIDMTNLVNIYNTQHNLIHAIYKRNMYIISNLIYMQDSNYIFSQFDRYIMQNIEINFLDEKTNYKINITLQSEVNNIYKLIAYTALLLQNLNLTQNIHRIKQELHMLSTSCILENDSNYIYSMHHILHEHKTHIRDIYAQQDISYIITKEIKKTKIHRLIHEANLPIYYGLYIANNQEELAFAILINLYKIKHTLQSFILITNLQNWNLLKQYANHTIFQYAIKTAIVYNIKHLNEWYYQFLDVLNNIHVSTVVIIQDYQYQQYHYYLQTIARYFNKKITIYTCSMN